METKKIEHRLGTFTFEYDESKPWTEDDDLMLNRYMEVLDIEVQLNEKTTEVFKLYADHKKNIETFRASLLPIKEQLTTAQQASDQVLDNIAIQKPNAYQNWTDQIHNTHAIITKIDSDLDILVQERDTILTPYNQLIQEEESQQKWDQFAEIQHKHYQNYEGNSINICSFDHEDQKMRGTITFHNHRNQDLLNYCEKTIQNYNTLMIEIDRIYRIWEEHVKRVRLIELIISERAGISAISMN